MSDLQLIYNKETGCWERKPEPYLTLEIATQADFEELKAAVEFYKNRDKYVEQKHGHWQIVYKENVWGEKVRVLRCSRCKKYTVNGRGITEPSDCCPNCGAKMDERMQDNES